MTRFRVPSLSLWAVLEGVLRQIRSITEGDLLRESIVLWETTPARIKWAEMNA